ncbi:unnamed protein product [Bursaphelenchus xylophilus]|uniref:(pine wood nematode) hypothetical protein n=1 Tax=Bursaphelenchus xylophilus TaxID=6326 RepID=A0A1I7RKR9_BURXY|nr:unnamed protein product [Bursaphelenchus xylophilus]CAG9131124.1 unnamed protein product [Bursaphelenchus xylophilus]
MISDGSPGGNNGEPPPRNTSLQKETSSVRSQSSSDSRKDDLKAVGLSTISVSEDAVPIPVDPEELKGLKAREHLFTRRRGYSYHCVVVRYRKGAKFGLVIKNADNSIFVSKMDPNSLCVDKLMIGDRLIDVDGTPIKDREEAKKLMLQRLGATRKVSFIVERPVSSEAKLCVKTALLSASTRTSSTAPREKGKWAARSALQRENAKKSSQEGYH